MLQGQMNRDAAAENNVIGDVASGATLNMDHWHDVVCKMYTTATGNETRMAPLPHGAGIGARVLLQFVARSGGGTPTIALTQKNAAGADIAFNQAGNTTITFTAPNAWAYLVRMLDDGVPAWRLVANNDCTLT